MKPRALSYEYTHTLTSLNSLWRRAARGGVAYAVAHAREGEPVDVVVAADDAIIVAAAATLRN